MFSGAVSGVEEAAEVLLLPNISWGTSRVGVGLSPEVGRGRTSIKGLWKNWSPKAIRRRANDSSRRLGRDVGKYMEGETVAGKGVTLKLSLILGFELGEQ